MNNEHPTYWFPLKSFGWGWGPPVRWQGWAVLIGYLLVIAAAIFLTRARFEPITRFLLVLLLTAVFVAVVAAKGERSLRWKWGGK